MGPFRGAGLVQDDEEREDSCRSSGDVDIDGEVAHSRNQITKVTLTVHASGSVPASARQDLGLRAPHAPQHQDTPARYSEPFGKAAGL